jgi:DNA polymerase V
LYRRYVGNRKIRNLSIAFAKLRLYDSPSQLSFLQDAKEQEEKRNLHLAMDYIADTYGKNAVLRASSLTGASTIRERHGYIGGHRA